MSFYKQVFQRAARSRSKSAGNACAEITGLFIFLERTVDGPHPPNHATVEGKITLLAAGREKTKKAWIKAEGGDGTALGTAQK